jgi:hypothetical protein
MYCLGKKMSVPAPARMTSNEFIAWAMSRPRGERYELTAGEVVAMAPERAVHARTKLRVVRRLAQAIEAQGLGCETYADGMAVEVDATTIYEPIMHAMLRARSRPGSSRMAPSPSTRRASHCVTSSADAAVAGRFAARSAVMSGPQVEPHGVGT